jgi:hypothetical protein
MEDNRRKNSLWALLLTLLITGGTLALLLNFSLRYVQDPNLPDLTQLAQDSILFGGDYVMLGNTLEDVQNDMMDQESADPSPRPRKVTTPTLMPTTWKMPAKPTKRRPHWSPKRPNRPTR